MGTGNFKKFFTFLIVAVCLSGAGLALADNHDAHHFEGWIVAVNGDLVSLKGADNISRDFSVSNRTKFRIVDGLTGRPHGDTDPGALMPGLWVIADVESEDAGLHAIEVRFELNELRAAQESDSEPTPPTAKVFFEPGSATISQRGMSDLRALATQANETKNYGLVLQGFKDLNGSTGSVRLSESRASAVEHFLKNDAGLAPERIHTADSLPIWANAGPSPNIGPQTVVVKLVADGRPKEKYTVIRVGFATDRNRHDGLQDEGWFGSQRSEVLSYGFCSVSIPSDHRLGNLESPSWHEISEDPNKHMVVRGIEVQGKPTFYSAISAALKFGKNSSLIFVHGYNVTFKDAARRTAQMAYDLGFKGPAIFYSWPSQGTTPSYSVDEQSIEWSQPNLEAFLIDYAKTSGSDSIYLVAHSMGSRALSRAISNAMAKNPSLRLKIKQVFLAAPDIDADVFRRDIAPALAAAGRPITLYASSEDLAIQASRSIHGSPRAGDSGDGLVIVKGIETIDASAVDTSFIGHSYIGDRNLLSDIYDAIRTGASADDRFGLSRQETSKGIYWIFRK